MVWKYVLLLQWLCMATPTYLCTLATYKRVLRQLHLTVYSREVVWY